MSCYILQADSFEALAVTLARYNVRVPSSHVPRNVADVDAWATLAWAASDSNAIAYCNRYGEHVEAHPLEERYRTFEAWRDRLRDVLDPRAIVRTTRPRPRSEVALVKLLDCMSYQIADAPEGSVAAVIGEALHRLSGDVAHAIVARSEGYQRAPWGDGVEVEEVVP